MRYYDQYGPNLFPSVVINNQTYRGQLEVEEVFNAVCSGFYTVPRVCKKYLETNDINNSDLTLMAASTLRVGTGRAFKLVVLIMGGFCIFLYCYRRSAKRQMKKEMKTQVESAVNQYLALRNNDKEAGDRAMQSEMQTTGN